MPVKTLFYYFKDNREHFFKKEDEIEGKEESFRMAAEKSSGRGCVFYLPTKMT